MPFRCVVQVWGRVMWQVAQRRGSVDVDRRAAAQLSSCRIRLADGVLRLSSSSSAQNHCQGSSTARYCAKVSVHSCHVASSSQSDTRAASLSSTCRPYRIASAQSALHNRMNKMLVMESGSLSVPVVTSNSTKAQPARPRTDLTCSLNFSEHNNQETNHNTQPVLIFAITRTQSQWSTHSLSTSMLKTTLRRSKNSPPSFRKPARFIARTRSVCLGMHWEIESAGRDLTSITGS